MGRTARRVASVAAAIGAVCAARDARADRRPTLATDGFYVGMRVDPGVALLAGWDLDVYLMRDRIISIGPGVTLGVLGSPAAPGRQQDLQLAVDVARFKVGLNAPGGEWRPFAMLGAGFSYTRLAEQRVAGVSVTPAGGGAAVSGEQVFPTLEEFAPIISFGAGADLFMNGPLGVTVLFASHFHPTGSPRVPDVWVDLALGIRFGL
jgi:hypothetical protein